MENNWRVGGWTSNPKPPNPCWHYVRTGRCKFGDRCKYSHGVASNQPHKQELPLEVAKFFANSDATETKPKVFGKLREWKHQLVQGSSVSRPTPATISRFFLLALELMDGDMDSSQEVIKQLVTERGLLFIKDVVERHVEIAKRTGPSITFWTTEVKPLFQLITHPRVIDSAVLEGQVSSIFNFILGLGGRRMKDLFGYLVKLVQAWPNTSNDPDLTLMSVVELSLAVLTKILDCNTANIVNETFALINQQFADVVAQSTSDHESFARLQSLKYIDYIRRRIEVGNDIIAYQDLPVGPVIRENFVLRRDFPGKLSAEGPRHDNDFKDISNISILPTFEEIISPRAEYLPTTDSSTWHVGGIRGRIDREFRLLREDTVGQLRDAVRDVQEQMNRPQEHRLTTRNHLRTYMYENPTPINVMFGSDGGLELLVQCEQLTAVRNLKPKERHTWWQQSRRLQAGALVCLLDATGSVAFFVVSQSTMRTKDDEKFRRQTSKAEKPEDGQPANSHTLSDEAEFLYVTLQLAEGNDEAVQRLLEWYRAIGATDQKFLVEFPGILLDSFKHTLAALQDIYKRPDVPFSNIIAPPPEAVTDVLVQPPLFARRTGFHYNADCLQPGLMLSPSSNKGPDELASCSNLDPSQSMAILNTLSRELSLVQGPPGTGKSYTGEKIIQILLQNKSEAKLGPILCVCYTNHALDQLLEHLLDKGIDKVIRIGSRSKSERMINLNLKNIVQAFDKTKSEKAEIGKAYGEIKRISQEIVSGMRELAASQTLAAVKDHLQIHHPQHYNQLFPPSEDEDGWKVVSYQKSNSAIQNWLTSGHEDLFKHKPVEDLKYTNLLEMSSFERTILFENWLREIRDPIISSLVSLQREYRELFERRDRVGCDVKLRCLQQADVIGVTTTGLARNIGLLRRLRSKVLLCEEAGEVLEAHVLTALLPSLEQVILIGDHLQLRPQINNYELQSTNSEGAKYSLDMSLFERLVQPLYDTDPQVPYSTLETQRRMHPSIAALIRSTLYPSLQNAKNVSCYPEVSGMRQRLFWLHHEHLEAGASTHDPLNTSHSNDFEVEMATALVSHLIRQGEYQNGQIAVLTPYLGQLHKLRRRMASIFEICINDRDNEDLEAMGAENMDFEDQANPSNISKSSLLKTIRVATVDNFQGEEAEVVVISLVRSNPQSKCGFLSTSNRINVLLSRAKHGMYIIGNSNTYKSVPMWQKVIKQLDDEGNFGTELGSQSRKRCQDASISSASHVARTWPTMDTCANRAVENILHVATIAKILAGDARSGRVIRSWRKIMGSVKQSAAKNIRHVVTAAARLATPEASALLAARRARSGAATRNATSSATSHACRVQRKSANLAALMPNVQCLALYLATGFLAPSDARNSSIVDTSECASDEIKATCVDLFEMNEYRDIDLDQDPCIFPDCGHFLTVASMDGQMDMSSHYVIDTRGRPVDINKVSEPFSMDGAGVRVCPNCRGSLRNIARYGRIVRRAILDEATKKFISWSHAKYLSLASSLFEAESALETATGPNLDSVLVNFAKPKQKRPNILPPRLSYLGCLDREVNTRRYGSLIENWKKIDRFITDVKEEEQPFQRVADLVRHTNRQRRTQKQFRCDDSVIQVKSFLLALLLRLSCEICIMSDFFFKTAGPACLPKDFVLDLTPQLQDCDLVYQLAQKSKRPKEQVQALIQKAHLVAVMSSFFGAKASSNTGRHDYGDVALQMRQQGYHYLDQARQIMGEYSSTNIFEGMLASVQKTLDNGLHMAATKEELRAVYEAMSKELGSGTGHWYTCERGHYFTIGECGMPMEQARCHDCGARIGGQNHNLVDGVTRAEEIEQLARGVENL
ncbi:hypothetical protein E4U55_006169 [Claviceps digitariae]|nr:hypothetical protein E4U55_006169 [Claviceps digitariae]